MVGGVEGGPGRGDEFVARIRGEWETADKTRGSQRSEDKIKKYEEFAPARTDKLNALAKKLGRTEPIMLHPDATPMDEIELDEGDQPKDERLIA